MVQDVRKYTTVQGLLDVFWRRKLWVLVPLFLGLVGGVVWGRTLPSLYSAGALILVDAPGVPSAYVKTTITASIHQRIPTIRQQLGSRAVLVRLIEASGLYSEDVGSLPMEALVGRARRNLDVQVWAGQVIRISFAGTDPERIADAANFLTDTFIEQNLERRRKQAETTTEFLDDQLTATQGQLEDKEAMLAAFRQQHDGQLPEQREVHLTALAQLSRRLEIVQESLARNEIRSLLLRQQVAPDGKPVGRPDLLAQLRTELRDLRLRYTDRHPDVVSLQDRISRLEEAGPPPLEADADLEIVDEFDIAAEDPELQVLELERQRLVADRDAILEEIDKRQLLLELIPEVAQEQLSLTRDYGNLASSYHSLLDKRIDARLAETLEAQREGEQVMILERAVPPSSPFSPNHRKLRLLGLLIGTALGMGVAFLREETDQTFREIGVFESCYPEFRVLASVPRIEV